ncbi:hypothetical protein EVB91_280 [Rhizobium phage RHph_I1_18]|nr:hypothetical protein EVB91_280 [Rhizobium phage RHph_I1_18]
MKKFGDFLEDINPYAETGSGKEKQFYKQFYKGGQEIKDHDGDPRNWTEANVGKSQTAINANATDGDQATPTPSIDPKDVIADELPMKTYSGAGSSAKSAKEVKEDQYDVRDVYRDEIDDLIENISDLVNTARDTNSDLFAARGIAESLRSTRDMLLGALNVDVAATAGQAGSVKESIQARSYTLLDGKTVFVTEEDASMLNAMFESMTVGSADKLKTVMETSAADWNNVVDYARATKGE